MNDRFSDVERLVQHGRTLREIGAQPDPAARQVAGAQVAIGSRLGLLAGSFNPPTVAHRTLALAGLEADQLDAVWFALSIRTVDKEVVTGAELDDRLLMLDALAEDDARLGTLVLNRGLYVDQARIVRRMLPDLDELVFLVGHDKIVQIFDPRYYDDRDAALEMLFGLASFLVAPRGEDEDDALAALLLRPENQRFADAVRPLALPTELRAVASSVVRHGLAGGGQPDLTVPEVVAQFVAATGAYLDEERYARRRSVIDEGMSAASLDPSADLSSFGPRLRQI